MTVNLISVLYGLYTNAFKSSHFWLRVKILNNLENQDIFKHLVLCIQVDNSCLVTSNIVFIWVWLVTKMLTGENIEPTEGELVKNNSFTQFLLHVGQFYEYGNEFAISPASGSLQMPKDARVWTTNFILFRMTSSCSIRSTLSKNFFYSNCRTEWRKWISFQESRQ